MAVARVELNIGEIDWVVKTLTAAGVPDDMKRAMRELKRGQQAGHESLAREQAHLAKMRRGFRTAPENNVVALDHGQRARCAECHCKVLPNGQGHKADCSLSPVPAA